MRLIILIFSVLGMFAGLAVTFLHARSVAFLVPLFCVAAVAVYFVQASRDARRAGELAGTFPGQRSPDENRARIFPIGVKVAAAAAATPLLFWALQRFEEKWHPPVEEHRTELLAAAREASSCAADRLAVVVESPSTARIEGCGKTWFFVWGRQRRGERLHWRQYDPNCTVDWLGLKLRCY